MDIEFDIGPSLNPFIILSWSLWCMFDIKELSLVCVGMCKSHKQAFTYHRPRKITSLQGRSGVFLIFNLEICNYAVFGRKTNKWREFFHLPLE